MVASEGGHPAAVIDAIEPGAATWPVVKYEAAGGVVVHEGMVLLLERRNGEVRLPKGHREPGESSEACALREVREETGVWDVEVAAPLGSIENRFAHRGRCVVQHLSWYLMRATAPAIRGYVCDQPDEPDLCWTPAWRSVEEAAGLLTFEAERLALAWGLAASTADEDESGVDGV